MKNNKKPGESEISAEMLKAGGEQLHEKLFLLIEQVWEQEAMPKEWSKALISPLHKKGDKMLCKNYRGIALLDTCYKILAMVLRKRLNGYAEERIGEYQAGFRSNRSTTDQIFTVKEIQTTCYEHKIALHILFIDFRQAYDRIMRDRMYQALSQLEIPAKLIRLVKMTLQRTTNKIVWNGLEKGLRHGDPLSTALFNLVLERIIRESSLEANGTIFNKEHQCIAYADDLTLIAKSSRELVKRTKRLIREASKYGLEINSEKTKYMIAGSTDIKKGKELNVVAYDGKEYKFKRVDKFVYLGVLLEENGHEWSELKARIATGNQKCGSLNALIKSKYVFRKTKLRIYTSVIRPTVTYGREMWVMNKLEEETLDRWERKILRIIYRGRNTPENWTRRTNQELENLYDGSRITSFYKSAKNEMVRTRTCDKRKTVVNGAGDET